MSLLTPPAAERPPTAPPSPLFETVEAVLTTAPTPLHVQQRALIVAREGARTLGLNELNEALRAGWRIAFFAPLNDADPEGSQFTAMVVLERRLERGQAVG